MQSQCNEQRIGLLAMHKVLVTGTTNVLVVIMADVRKRNAFHLSLLPLFLPSIHHLPILLSSA